MLLEFSLGNFWSFKEVQTLQLEAANIKSKFPYVDQRNLSKVSPKLSVLKSKAIYGANGSGKSNVIRGITNMLSIIQNCLRNNNILEENISPFALNDDWMKAPSFFQITFILDKHIYRYGFEATQQAVKSEWLFGKPLPDASMDKTPRERYYFTREGMEVKVNSEHFGEGEILVNSRKNNNSLFSEKTLFLSVNAAFNGHVSNQISDYLHSNITLISGLQDDFSENSAIEAMSDEKFANQVGELLRGIDPSIHRLEKVEKSLDLKSDYLKEQRKGQILVYRLAYDATGHFTKQVPLNLYESEAEGTKKLFSISPFIFQTINKGGTLFIDEMDARLHPRLTRKIVELFNSIHNNPNNAQLIFVTHDTNLQEASLLRRDQISFVEKNNLGESSLYSLVEVKGVRNDASFEKDYLAGKYYAVPNNLNAFEEAITEYIYKNKED